MSVDESVQAMLHMQRQVDIANLRLLRRVQDKLDEGDVPAALVLIERLINNFDRSVSVKERP